MQPEARLTKKIIEALRKEGALAEKIHGGTFQSRGLPDVIACLDSFFLGLEVKMPGKEKTVTKLQRKKLWAIYNAGGVAMMVTSVEQALEVVKLVKQKHRAQPNVEPYTGEED